MSDSVVTANNDDKSIASIVSSIELNEDDFVAIGDGHKDSVPSVPFQPRNPTPVIVPHPHRSSTGGPVASNVCYVGYLTKIGQKKKGFLTKF